jgi:hypothetical protein
MISEKEQIGSMISDDTPPYSLLAGGEKAKSSCFPIGVDLAIGDKRASSHRDGTVDIPYRTRTKNAAIVEGKIGRRIQIGQQVLPWISRWRADLPSLFELKKHVSFSYHDVRWLSRGGYSSLILAQLGIQFRRDRFRASSK